MLNLLIPWVVYSVSFSFLQLDVGTSALLSICIFLVCSWQRITSKYMVEVCTIIVFFIIFVLHRLFELELNYEQLKVLSYTVLTLSGWYTILIGNPFCLRYAKNVTDEKYWGEPIFYVINLHLSIVWSITFLINTFLSVSAILMSTYWPAFTLLSYAVILFSAVVTKIYPDFYSSKHVEAQ